LRTEVPDAVAGHHERIVRAALAALEQQVCQFGCGPQSEEDGSQYVGGPGIALIPACPIHGWVTTLLDARDERIAALEQERAEALAESHEFREWATSDARASADAAEARAAAAERERDEARDLYDDLRSTSDEWRGRALAAKRQLDVAVKERDNWHASNYAERRARLAAERAAATLADALEWFYQDRSAIHNDHGTLNHCEGCRLAHAALAAYRAREGAQ
jgi:hypothetical protein